MQIFIHYYIAHFLIVRLGLQLDNVSSNLFVLRTITKKIKTRNLQFARLTQA